MTINLLISSVIPHDHYRHHDDDHQPPHQLCDTPSPWPLSSSRRWPSTSTSALWYPITMTIIVITTMTINLLISSVIPHHHDHYRHHDDDHQPPHQLCDTPSPWPLSSSRRWPSTSSSALWYPITMTIIVITTMTINLLISSVIPHHHDHYRHHDDDHQPPHQHCDPVAFLVWHNVGVVTLCVLSGSCLSFWLLLPVPAAFISSESAPSLPWLSLLLLAQEALIALQLCYQRPIILIYTMPASCLATDTHCRHTAAGC